MQFRQQALSKLQSPEELDLPVRLARPRGLLTLAVTLLAMAAGALWATTGYVDSTVSAPGILTYGQGSYVVQSPVAGQVTAVLAKEGGRVAADAPLVKVRRADGGTDVVRALAAGRVTSLAATIGSVVTTGADVAAVERTAHAHDPLMAMLYVPASGGASVAPGQPVDLTLPSVPEGTYGVLRGTVKAVGRTTRTRRQIAAFLGDDQLAARFTRGGQPVAVLVTLDASRSTKSGYAWSSPAGPPFALTSMTPADGSVRVARQHPAEWLLP
ncbi:HlyD family efflux transporter periplasmic adaptor subunit [Streptomyces montanisoli]|uniref:HlyD family efflux transporter periplasmic adaptor subunit n=1 Tax=Streptomyces montanisoli TaxID=2798581 RepID=A0A940MFZ5_9ACTN|nr:HlyD family efflux transporter periplasmic adaptor subunit [Streptomyces montanisoli]MBP0458491.1 HlyD family efflux transporter periplasmic adaptor subunit [Streptomyces montanisoli]